MTALTPPGAALQLWGGVECSVVRIGDTWRDQARETGHHARAGADVARIAALGIRTLRTPLLWEQVAAHGWAWHDRQMAALATHGIGAVAGLVHHGSGPPGTGLLDPAFPERLAVHARAAAERYPEVAAWVPVNEPLTTARFSALYGHWYPHARDEAAFMRATAIQCRAILLSMRAIRAVRPDAAFIHTEDIGHVFATEPARDQADYENGRRFLSLDLLCGHVDARHRFRAALEANGIPAGDLDELATGEATPDLVGFNHYATSDRFLDHRVRLYPPALHGGNGRQEYADTEALRVDLGSERTGIAPRLREVWARYRLPIAITEAHLGCDDPREQVRWLMEAWTAATALRAEGADVRAVTAWALFGLTDWSSMLLERRGHYEPGAFDIRADPPAPGLLAEAIASLAQNGGFDHACLQEPGWWRREDRVHAMLRRA